MADGTRFKTLEEQIKKQDLQMKEVSDEWGRRLDDKLERLGAEVDVKIEKLGNQLEAKLEAQIASMVKLLTIEKNAVKLDEVLTEKPPLLPTPTGVSRINLEDEHSGGWRDKTGRNPWSNQPRVELSMFTGENPREWLRRCQKFFTLYQITDPWKVDAVELYLEGRAEIWYQSMKMVKGKVSWAEFSDAVSRRFGEKGGRDEVEEFNKLQQVGTVLEYQEKFEELNPWYSVEIPDFQKIISFPVSSVDLRRNLNRWSG